MDGTMVLTKNSMCAMFCSSAGLERGGSDILEPPRRDAIVSKIRMPHDGAWRIRNTRWAAHI
jgi:hypothetical protein